MIQVQSHWKSRSLHSTGFCEACVGLLPKQRQRGTTTFQPGLGRDGTVTWKVLTIVTQISHCLTALRRCEFRSTKGCSVGRSVGQLICDPHIRKIDPQSITTLCHRLHNYASREQWSISEPAVRSAIAMVVPAFEKFNLDLLSQALSRLHRRIWFILLRCQLLRRHILHRK